MKRDMILTSDNLHYRSPSIDDKARQRRCRSGVRSDRCGAQRDRKDEGGGAADAKEEGVIRARDNISPVLQVMLVIHH